MVGVFEKTDDGSLEITFVGEKEGDTLGCKLGVDVGRIVGNNEGFELGVKDEVTVD